MEEKVSGRQHAARETRGWPLVEGVTDGLKLGGKKVEGVTTKGSVESRVVSWTRGGRGPPKAQLINFRQRFK